MDRIATHRGDTLDSAERNEPWGVGSKKIYRAEGEARMMVRFDEEESSSAPISVRERMVNQQLLLQNEYLLAENRILRAHLPTRLL